MKNENFFPINKKGLKKRKKLERKWNFWYKLGNYQNWSNICNFYIILSALIFILLIICYFISLFNVSKYKNNVYIFLSIYIFFFLLSTILAVLSHYVENIAEKKKMKFIDYCFICHQCGEKITSFNCFLDVENGYEKRLFGDICENCGQITNESYFIIKE